MDFSPTEEDLYAEEEIDLNDEMENDDSHRVQSNSNLLDRMEVNVRAEVGQVLMNLSQVLSLTPGDTLSISELPPIVRLVANNAVIGEGYLVEFNGRIGVRISKIADGAFIPPAKNLQISQI